MLRSGKTILMISLSMLSIVSAYAQSIPAPIQSAGNQWVYSTQDLWSSKQIQEISTTVTGISDQYMRTFTETKKSSKTGELLLPQTSEATIHTDLTWSQTFRDETYPVKTYNWPLEPGKKWSYITKREIAATVAGAQPTIVTDDNSAEVGKLEVIEVPAGKFKAIKIVIRDRVFTETAVLGATITTNWYSPEVHKEVQSTYETFLNDGTPIIRTISQLIRYKAK